MSGTASRARRVSPLPAWCAHGARATEVCRARAFPREISDGAISQPTPETPRGLYIFAAATDASKRFMVQDIVIKPLEKTRVVAAAPCRAATELTGLRAGRLLEKCVMIREIAALHERVRGNLTRAVHFVRQEPQRLLAALEPDVAQRDEP